MDPLSNLVVLWGGALLLANIIFDPIFASFRAATEQGSFDISSDKSPFMMIGFGLVTLIVMGFLAQENPKWAKSMMWVLAGLSVLWLISYTEQKNAPKSTTTTTKGTTPAYGVHAKT
jgi:hypothetical protein